MIAKVSVRTHQLVGVLMVALGLGTVPACAKAKPSVASQGVAAGSADKAAIAAALGQVFPPSKYRMEVDAVRTLGDWAVELATPRAIKPEDQGMGQLVGLLHKVNGSWQLVDQSQGSAGLIESKFPEWQTKYQDAPKELFAQPFGS